MVLFSLFAFLATFNTHSDEGTHSLYRDAGAVRQNDVEYEFFGK